jgi:hypothetical protein
VEDDLDQNLQVDNESDDDMDSEETDSDDDDQFEFSWESEGEYHEEGAGYEFSIVTTVWVESRALEDAAA